MDDLRELNEEDLEQVSGGVSISASFSASSSGVGSVNVTLGNSGFATNTTGSGMVTTSFSAG